MLFGMFNKIKKGYTDVGLFSLAVFAIVVALLVIFILYPIVVVIIEAFTVRSGFSFNNFLVWWSNPLYRQSMFNTLMLASIVVLTTSLAALPVSYLMTRYDFPGKNIFYVILILAMISPPFVGALGLRFVFDPKGMVNMFLMQNGIINSPIPFLTLKTSFQEYLGIHWGVVFIETIHLFPLMFLNVVAALENIDPSLEEEAKTLGASGLTLFRKIIFQLMAPGYLAGIILVFIYVVSDTGTPLILNYQTTMAIQAYLVVLFAGFHYSPMGYVFAVIMAIISIICIFLNRKYLSLKRFASILRGAAVRKIPVIRGWKRIAIYIFLGLISLAGLLPLVGLFLWAFSKYWGMTVLPTEWTLENIFAVFSPRYVHYLWNSLTYSFVAMGVGIVLGTLIGFIMARKEFLGKDALDYLSMLPLMVPGIIVGIGYWRVWSGTPLDPFTATTIILPICISFRKLPYAVRAGYAGMLQIPKDYEEAAVSLGASWRKTLTKITLPVLLPTIFAGGLLTFINAFLELSTTQILCEDPSGGTLTYAIFMEFLGHGAVRLEFAAAIGVVLVIVEFAILVILYKFFGFKMGAMFRTV